MQKNKLLNIFQKITNKLRYNMNLLSMPDDILQLILSLNNNHHTKKVCHRFAQIQVERIDKIHKIEIGDFIKVLKEEKCDGTKKYCWIDSIVCRIWSKKILVHITGFGGQYFNIYSPNLKVMKQKPLCCGIGKW